MKCQKCDNKADLVTINLCQHCLSKVTYLPLNTGIPCPVCSKDIFQGNTLVMKNVDKINAHDSLAAKAELLDELIKDHIPEMEAIASMAGINWLQGQLRLSDVICSILSKSKGL